MHTTSLRRQVTRIALVLAAAAVVGPVTATAAAADPAPGIDPGAVAAECLVDPACAGRLRPIDTMPTPAPTIVLHPGTIICAVNPAACAPGAPAPTTPAPTTPAPAPASSAPPAAPATPAPSTASSAPAPRTGTDTGAGTSTGRAPARTGTGMRSVEPGEARASTATKAAPEPTGPGAGGTAGGGADTAGALATPAGPADEGGVPLVLVAGLTVLGAATTAGIVLAVRRRTPAAW